ncbi:hypothetical protein [Polyangium aurulentum]|uniref:hypothetical protein n=1 Tax=Polyangium aurulentum TaxID=2567896 RepID=UPI0010ADCF0D|nr:hypothetical protein [Polyangium aurulentum]UQA61364.1 hypothetical protein E8A73_013170 [Polyangium aurulentum]
MRMRASQVLALQSHFESTFTHRLKVFLAERLPEARGALAGEEGLARLEARISVARSLGFRGERDACKYVTLSFLLGEDFHEAHWAAAALVDPRHRTPTDRAEALWNAAKQRELDEFTTESVRASD